MTEPTIESLHIAALKVLGVKHCEPTAKGLVGYPIGQTMYWVTPETWWETVLKKNPFDACLLAKLQETLTEEEWRTYMDNFYGAFGERKLKFDLSPAAIRVKVEAILKAKGVIQ